MSNRLEKKKITRRDFLGLAGLWTAGITILFSLFGLVRMVKPRALPEASSVFRIGKPSSYPPGTVKDLLAEKVRVIATKNGVAVMSLVCTHLGCIVKEAGEEFLCPCHGSRFDKNGKVLAGPAPRPLRWLKVTQAPDNTLLADRGREVTPGYFYQI